MSETDDTDVLLLIPPDFFLVPSSDSEDGDKTPLNKYKPKLPLSKTVVNDLLFQLSSLENRISLIESQSDTSNLQSLEGSIYDDSPKQFKKPLTPPRNRRKMSGIRGRFSISTDNIKAYDSSSVQSTPQKPKHKFSVNSLPTTPSTVTDYDSACRNRFQQNPYYETDKHSHSPARSNLSTRYDPSGNSHDSLQMSLNSLKDGRNLTLEELNSRYERNSKVSDRQKYVPEVNSQKNMNKNYTDTNTATDIDADESSLNTSPEKQQEQGFLKEIDNFLRNVKIIQNHLTQNKNPPGSNNPVDYSLHDSPEFKAIARMQLAESAAVRKKALANEKTLEDTKNTIDDLQNISQGFNKRLLLLQQERNSQTNMSDTPSGEYSSSTSELQGSTQTHFEKEPSSCTNTEFNRHIDGALNENTILQNTNVPKSLKNTADSLVVDKSETNVKNHQRTIETLLQALQDKQNELLELQKKTKTNISQENISDQNAKKEDTRQEKNNLHVSKPGENVGSVPDYGLGMRNIMYSNEPNIENSVPNLNVNTDTSKRPAQEPKCIKKYAYTVGDNTSVADETDQDIVLFDKINQNHQSGDSNLPDQYLIYTTKNRIMPIGEDNHSYLNKQSNNYTSAMVPPSKMDSATSMGNNLMSNSTNSGSTLSSQSNDIKRSIEGFDTSLMYRNISEKHKSILKNQPSSTSTSTQESDIHKLPDSSVKLKYPQTVYKKLPDISKKSEGESNTDHDSNHESNFTSSGFLNEQKSCTSNLNENMRVKFRQSISSQNEPNVERLRKYVQSTHTQTEVNSLSPEVDSIKNGNLLSLSELWGLNSIGCNTVLIENDDLNKIIDQKLKEERFRRQHCEKLIEALQVRLLESQEKLAVAMKVDMAKDDAINKLRDVCAVATNRCEQFQLERNEFFKELEILKENTSVQITEANKKVQHYENELSKALEIAHASQTQAVDSQKHLVLLKMDVAKAQDEKNILAENIQQLEKESSKDKKLLNDSRQSLLANKKVIETSQAEMKKLQEENTQLQKKLTDEQKKLNQLENQKSSIQRSLDESKINEKKLQTELQSVSVEAEKSKTELRAFYQRQVETVVKEKLQEFQNQLEAAEKAMQGQIEVAQLQVARTAAQYMQETIEKYQLEIHLLEERHNEEIQLHVLKLSEAERNVQEMKSKLKSYNYRKVQLAKQLHSLMESQWKEALRILTNNGQSPGIANSDVELKKPDSSADIQKLLSMHTNDDLTNLGVGSCITHNYQRPHSAPEEKPTSDRDQQDAIRDKNRCLQSTSYSSLVSGTSGEEIPFSKDGQQTYRKTHTNEQNENDTPVSSRSFQCNSKENELQKYIKMLLERSPSQPVARDNQHDTANKQIVQSPTNDGYETPTWQPVINSAHEAPTHYTADKIKLKEQRMKPPWK